MSTEAQKRASTNYNRRQDNIMIRPSQEEGAAIRAAAAAAGMSLQAYILQAIRGWMEHEQAGAVHDKLFTGDDSTEGTGWQSGAWDSGGGPRDISVLSDDTPTPPAIAAVSPTQNAETAPSKLSPDDWAEWARRQDDESLEDWKARLKKSNVGTSTIDIMKRIGKLPRDDRNLILETDPVKSP